MTGITSREQRLCTEPAEFPLDDRGASVDTPPLVGAAWVVAVHRRRKRAWVSDRIRAGVEDGGAPAPTLEIPACTLRLLHRVLQELARIVGNARQEADARRVVRGIRQVSVVEDDEVALEERGAEDPAVERVVGRCAAGAADGRSARCRVAGLGLGDEVAGVDGETLAADLESEVVRRVARECGRVGYAG